MWDEIEAWTLALEAERGLSLSTIRLYTHAVRRFALWFESLRRGRPYRVTRQDALAYRAFLLDRGYAPSTINRTLTSLRIFFTFVSSSAGVSELPDAPGHPPSGTKGSTFDMPLAQNPFYDIPPVPLR